MTNKKSLLVLTAIIAIALIFPLHTNAYAGSSTGTLNSRHSDHENTNVASNSIHRASIFKELGHDFKYMSGDPTFYLVMAGLSVTPSFVSHETPEVNEAWANNLRVDHVFELGNVMGNGVLPVTTSVLALAYGSLAHHPRASDFGSDLLRAQAVNGILTLSLKGIINRPRPSGAPYGFPSGHTSTSFATAAVVYRHFGWKWGLPAAVAASYVGLSRLQENKHYLSDVIAGAVLGSYVGYKVAGRQGDARSLYIAPMAGDINGITASIRF
jgi:membrane-associated phospholipid phosphatase